MRRSALTAFVILTLGAAACADTTKPTTAQESTPEPKRVLLAGDLPAEIKCHKVKSGHLMVQPEINGQQLSSFIFDTGAGMSCVDKQVVEKLKLKPAGEATALGSGGQQATRLCAIDSLMLGPVTVEGSTVVELELRGIGVAIGEKLDGIIGYEYFLPAVFEIDAEKPRIVVHDPAKYSLPEGANWEPLVLVDRRPHVSGSIEGHEPGLFLVDTGANTALTIENRAVKQLKLLENRETGNSFTGGVGGLLAARSGVLKSFMLGQIEVKDLKATLAKSDKGASKDENVQGTIGLDLLKRYILVVDYPAKRVAFIPR